jgi:hypothetical protein
MSSIHIFSASRKDRKDYLLKVYGELARLSSERDRKDTLPDRGMHVA